MARRPGTSSRAGGCTEMTIINPRPALILGASAVAVSGAADTNENILATINLAAGALGLNGILRITIHWLYTSSANNKTFRTRLGGISGTAYGSLTVGAGVLSLRQQVQIGNRGAANSQEGTDGAGGGWGTTLSNITSAIDTAVAQTVVLTGQKASAGDTLTLESYLAELLLPGLT